MILRTYHTLKYLKFVQLYGRAVFFLKRKFSKVASPDHLCNIALELKHFHGEMPSSPLVFSFLNNELTFRAPAIPWTPERFTVTDNVPNKLWRYNLNYFSYLNNSKRAQYQKASTYIILDWIEKNHDPRMESWEPYPLSKRIFNWTAWLKSQKEISKEVTFCITESIFLQCKRLEYELEFHNQANHLLENLKALFCTAVYLLLNSDKNIKQLKKWIFISMSLLQYEIQDQFLEDGGHYERSPMYHKEMLCAVMQVLQSINGLKIESNFSTAEMKPVIQLEELCKAKLPAIKAWLSFLTHPDGNISLFGDSASQTGHAPIVPNPDKDISYLLKDSGYFIRIWDNAYFALTCGEPMPSFQPGHSHCDISSYEFTLNKVRCIIDTGCGSYQDPKIRNTCRKSSSHNIPLIENSEQSDLWANFRFGKRAKVTSLKWDLKKHLLETVFTDQNEQRYTREVIFSNSQIKIRDRLFDRKISGTFCSLLHLAPEVVVLPSEDGSLNFSTGTAEFKISTAAQVKFTASSYFPEFGVKIQSQKIILSNHESEAIDYVITW